MKEYKQNKFKPPQTESQYRRQQKNWEYSQAALNKGASSGAAASSTGGQSPDGPEEIPHQLVIPWPHSYKQMTHDFMKEWMDKADELGFSLRLGSWRNAAWKTDPVLSASQYRLRITAQDPDMLDLHQRAVGLVVEFALASKTLHLLPSSLPWADIIQWWDGED